MLRGRLVPPLRPQTTAPPPISSVLHCACAGAATTPSSKYNGVGHGDGCLDPTPGKPAHALPLGRPAGSRARKAIVTSNTTAPFSRLLEASAKDPGLPRRRTTMDCQHPRHR